MGQPLLDSGVQPINNTYTGYALMELRIWYGKTNIGPIIIWVINSICRVSSQQHLGNENLGERGQAYLEFCQNYMLVVVRYERHT